MTKGGGRRKKKRKKKKRKKRRGRKEKKKLRGGRWVPELRVECNIAGAGYLILKYRFDPYLHRLWKPSINGRHRQVFV
jgi:hypothetical protein